MKKIKGSDKKPLKMTFTDEFEGDSLNHWDGHGSDGLWATSFSPHQDDTRYLNSNGEGQYYIDPTDPEMPNPFSVNDGVLAITAQELTPEQSALADGQAYGSGLITTEMTLHTEGGYIEVSAQVPDQQGFLSAFWLIPADGDWTSEIDGFEILGHDTERLNTNYWIDGVPHEEPIQTTDLSDGFHTYGIQWDGETITWYLDGEVVRVTEASITEPMQLAISLAVDTNWTGSPDETTDFNDALLIDYIEVYEPMSSSNPGISSSADFVNQVDDIAMLNDTTFLGTQFDDTITGNRTDDKIYGREGDDALAGGRGDDELFGSDGNDAIDGGRGNDKLIGGEGEDTIEGGRGNDNMWGGTFSGDNDADVFVFGKHSGSDVIHDFDVDNDLIDLSSFSVSFEEVHAAMIEDVGSVTIDLSQLGGHPADEVVIRNLWNGETLGEDQFIL